MGEQGCPMFDKLALQATGLEVPDAGRTADGYRISAWLDGELIGEDFAPRMRRPGPDGTTEVVGLRVIVSPRAFDVWGREVVMEGEVRGADGEVAAATRTFVAERP